MKRWLVYYKQRRHGSDRWIDANAVIEKTPAEFLLSMLEKHPDCESRLMWAMEIDGDATAERLGDML